LGPETGVGIEAQIQAHQFRDGQSVSTLCAEKWGQILTSKTGPPIRANLFHATMTIGLVETRVASQHSMNQPMKHSNCASQPTTCYAKYCCVVATQVCACKHAHAKLTEQSRNKHNNKHPIHATHEAPKCQCQTWQIHRRKRPLTSHLSHSADNKGVRAHTKSARTLLLTHATQHEADQERCDDKQTHEGVQHITPLLQILADHCRSA